MSRCLGIGFSRQLETLLRAENFSLSSIWYVLIPIEHGYTYSLITDEMITAPFDTVSRWKNQGVKLCLLLPIACPVVGINSVQTEDRDQGWPEASNNLIQLAPPTNNAHFFSCPSFIKAASFLFKKRLSQRSVTFFILLYSFVHSLFICPFNN